MRANARHHQQHDVGEGHAQRDLEHSLGTTRAMNGAVHPLSVRGTRAGFKRRWKEGTSGAKSPRSMGAFYRSAEALRPPKSFHLRSSHPRSSALDTLQIPVV